MIAKKVLLFVTALFMMTSVVWATAPPHLWSQSFGDSNNQAGLATFDASGNIIATGYQEGTVNFGGGPLTSMGKQDIYLAKFNAAGTHLWSYVFGDTGSQYSQGAVVGSSGNIVLTAFFNGTVDFGGGGLTSAGSNDIAVAKFDTDGTHLWSQRFGDANNQSVRTAAVDGSENIVVGGSFEGTVDFGGGGLTSAGGDDIYLVKFDASGAHLWSQRFGDANAFQSAGAVTVDTVGNVILTGTFAGSVDFGGGSFTTTTPYDYDIYVAKFDASGSHLWSRRFGDSSIQMGVSVATDVSGNVIVTGAFSGSVDFGGGALASTGPGDMDIFVVKLDASGSHLWSQRFGDPDMQLGGSLAVDNSGNLLLSAIFEGDVDFGGGVLTSAGSWDIALAMFDAGSTHLWSQSFGDSSMQMGGAVDIDGSGNVLLGGSLEGAVDFGGGVLTSAGMSDILIAKFGAMVSPPIVVSAIPDTTVAEDSPPVDNYRDLNDVFIDVEDGTTLGFTIESNSDPGLVSVVIDADSAMDLSFAPNESGSATIIVRATDSDAEFAEDTLTVTVTPVNDPPIVVSAIPDTTVAEDSPPVDNYRDLNDVFIDVEDGTTLGFTIESNSDPGLVSVVIDADSALDLSFTPGEVGSATIVIRATDAQTAFVEDTLEVSVTVPAPNIYAVRDVPGDEGGLVNVAWDASPVDTPGEHLITRYTVWRAIKPTLVSQMVDGGATLVKDASAVPPKSGEAVIREEHFAGTTYYWNLVKSVDAYYLDGYSEPVPTLFDSTDVSTEYHYFQIIAHTSDPYTFWTSPPDSGYSVDNLAPTAPSGLAGQYDYSPDLLTVYWHPNPEADISFYNVHRGQGPDFTPNDNTLIATTPDTLVTGLPYFPVQPWHIKVSAVDVHGNESEFTVLMPEYIPIPTLVTRFGSSIDQGRVSVTWTLTDVGRGFQFQVARRDQISGTYSSITPEISESQGTYRLFDTTTEPGTSYTYRVIVLDGNTPVGMFETTVTTPALELSLSQNYPNPFNPSTTIEFVLDDTGPIIIEVFKIDGRLVRSLVDRWMKPGAYSEEWDGTDNQGRHLASGVYFFRLRAGSRTLTRKAVLLK